MVQVPVLVRVFAALPLPCVQGEFLNQVGKAISDPSLEFINLLIYGFFFMVFMILLGLLVFILPSFVERRVRKIHHFGISLDDLKQMKETGLLSEDEYKKARQRIAQRYLDIYSQTESEEKSGSAFYVKLQKDKPESTVKDADPSASSEKAPRTEES